MKIDCARELKGWRLKRGVGQVDLAQKAGLTQATISRIESHLEQPQLETLTRLAEALEIDLTQFFLEEPRVTLKLDRHQIDAIARAVLSGRRELGSKLNKMADQVASLMTQFLLAHRLAGRSRVRTLRWRAPFRKRAVLSLVDEKTFKSIFLRVRKLLPLYKKNHERK